jgi:hypothetical protein
MMPRLIPRFGLTLSAKAGRFVGGNLFQEPNRRNGNVYYESGTDPHYRQLYFDKYVTLDPATTR